VFVILSLWNYVGDRLVEDGMFDRIICFFVLVECSMVLRDDVDLMVLIVMLMLLSSILVVLFMWDVGFGSFCGVM